MRRIGPLERRRLLSLAGILLALGCLALLGYIIYRERDVLAAHILQADPRQLLVVAACYVADLAIYIALWASVLASFGGRAPMAEHVKVFCQANAAKRLPGTLWYIGGRAALYGRSGIPARAVLVASAVEGAVIWLSGLALSIPALMVVLPQGRWLWLGLGSLLLAALLNPWSLRRILDRSMRGSRKADAPEAQGSFAPGVRLLRAYGWLLLGALGWAGGGILVAAIRTIFEPSPVTQWPALIGAWTVAGTASMLTFFLPSGFGVTEVTLTALLSRLTPAGVAVLVALSARILITILDILAGGLAYLLQGVRAAR